MKDKKKLNKNYIIGGGILLLIILNIIVMNIPKKEVVLPEVRLKELPIK